MRKKLLLLFLLLSFGALSAQSYNSKRDHDTFKNWKLNKLFRWHINGDPFLEFSYGLSMPKHKVFSRDFTDLGQAELKLGFSRLDEAYDSTIVELDERFAFVSNLSEKLKSEESGINDLNSELVRFGLAKRSGYGYDLGGVQILPYDEYGVVWARFKAVNHFGGIYDTDPYETDNAILRRYENEFRFGTLAEAGIRLQFANAVSFNAGYEAAVIFPRLLVWKYLGSVVIEGAVQSTLDYFIEDVLDSSPAAAPVVNFLLKNGLSYAFYALRRDRMNWPFKTETPLTYETFKVGVSFVF